MLRSTESVRRRSPSSFRLDPLVTLPEHIGKMSAIEPTPVPILPARRRARRFRIAGVIILLLGLVGAGLAYWLGTQAPDLADDLSMTGYYKAEAHQMGRLYGKEGLLIEDLINDLKQPGTQAFLIVVTAAVIAAGCFRLAFVLEENDKPS